MFKKTLTAAVAALTLSSATFVPTSSAQAGFLGKVAAGVAGVVVGAAVVSAASRPSYQPVHRGYEGGYRPVRGGYGACGFRNSPIFDEYGNRVGFRQIPTC